MSLVQIRAVHDLLASLINLTISSFYIHQQTQLIFPWHHGGIFPAVHLPYQVFYLFTMVLKYFFVPIQIQPMEWLDLMRDRHRQCMMNTSLIAVIFLFGIFQLPAELYQQTTTIQGFMLHGPPQQPIKNAPNHTTTSVADTNQGTRQPALATPTSATTLEWDTSWDNASNKDLCGRLSNMPTNGLMGKMAAEE